MPFSALAETVDEDDVVEPDRDEHEEHRQRDDP